MPQSKSNIVSVEWVNPPTTEQLMPLVKALARMAAKEDFEKALAASRSKQGEP